ncbi:hypothetical protein LX32DRAFT_315162 [Colletotrichum zoysiae]|uniref:Uncharacterized protein n=1 Tax=Colletotrichum zoysiae TaxID=1216348 RepID=A0AAD9HMC5_9PEZI|nr:hypothetical protein LX32DRAFT_315162 [Colletotrichum zoysiae]
MKGKMDTRVSATCRTLHRSTRRAAVAAGRRPLIIAGSGCTHWSQARSSFVFDGLKAPGRLDDKKTPRRGGDFGG